MTVDTTICKTIQRAGGSSLGIALWLILSPVLAAPPAGNLDAARLEKADSEPQNWFTGGRDKDGTYYSPLTSIDANNVKNLGFAWSYDQIGRASCRERV